MNEVDPVLRDVLKKVFRRESPSESVTDDDIFDSEMWTRLEDAGLPGVSISEEAGGSGGQFTDLAEVLRASGRYAAPVPILESSLASWVLTSVGAASPIGPSTMAIAQVRNNHGLVVDASPNGCPTVSGHLSSVPWARQAHRVVFVGELPIGPSVVDIPFKGVDILAGKNLAGESRDTLLFESIPAHVYELSDPRLVDATYERAALGRAIQMVGCMERCLELSVLYAKQRKQFGQAIAGFQAVQHLLSDLAGALTLAKAMAATASRAIDDHESGPSGAAAKVCAGISALAVMRAAHQIHGAIGFTAEHELQRYTRRLLAWRDDYGSEAFWSRMLGRFVAGRRTNVLWEMVTGSDLETIERADIEQPEPPLVL